jgi:hypothetical protein
MSRHIYLALAIAVLAAVVTVPAAVVADGSDPGSALNALAVLTLAVGLAVTFVSTVFAVVMAAQRALTTERVS